MRALALAVPIAGLLAGLFLGWTFVPGSASRPVSSTSRDDTSKQPGSDPATPPPEPASAAPAKEPPGTGRIEGRVTTPDGEPLEGVVVLAYRDRPREIPWRYNAKPTLDGLGPPDLDRSLAERLAELERDREYRRATRRSAVSGGDGRFVLTGLVDGYHGIKAFREGYAVRQDGDHWGGGRSGEFLELIATAVVRVPVRVLLPDGGEPDRAEVRVDGERHTWTPDGAWIDLLAGSADLRARVPDRDLASAPVTVEVTADQPPAAVDLRLVPVRGIRGTVTFPSGTGSAFHEVVALLLPDGADPSPRRLRFEGERIYLDSFAKSPVAFSASDLEPGRYLVGVRRHRQVLVSAEVTVGDLVEELDLVVPGPPEDAGPLTVRVLFPDGEPESHVSITPAWVDARGQRKTGQSAKRIRPGIYNVLGAVRKEGRSFELGIRSKRLGSRSIEVDPEAQEEITIRLEAPAFVTVNLEGWADSRAEAETRISVVSPGWHDIHPSTREPPPEPEGRQTFGPFAPGPHEVRVWVGTSSAPLLRRTVTLVSGENEATVAIPPLFVLEVLVEGKDGHEGFYLQRLAGRGRAGSHPRLEGMRLRFEHLTAGEYVLSRHFGTRVHMPLTITSDQVVRFRPLVLDALLVRIDDAAGLLARGGLRSGDLVLAIDGTEIAGEREAWALLALAASRGKGTLRIRRAGKVLDVELELAGDVSDPRQAGGELRPWTR